MANCLSANKRDILSDSQLETFSPDDRISNLLDDILFLILSFLTSKERANVSLISRRWFNLWVHSPVLDFHSPISAVSWVDYQERECFVLSVNRVLRQHKGQYLNEFKIVCELDKLQQKDIDNWLVFALERKVQSLELNLLTFGRAPFSLDDNYVFPNQLLNFSSKKAASNGGGIHQFDHRCLKSLSLKGVNFPDSAINLFLSTCSFIERLEVVGNSMLVNVVISGPNLSLKHMKIKYCPELKVVSVSNFNLVSLDIPTGTVTLAELPMLVELSISNTTFSLSRTLSQVSSFHSQLELLMLEGYKLKYINQLSNFDHMTKLKRLVISLGAYGDESLTTLVPLINSCPHLEEFVFMLIWSYPERKNTRSICEGETRGCSLKSQSLKVFEFLGYYGRVSDTELVLHIVWNAVSLEKIIIDPRNVRRLDGDSEKVAYKRREKEARSIASEQFISLRKDNYIPPHVHLSIL